MKIPAYIEKLINRRMVLAINFNSADCQLWEWLEKNGVAVEETDILSGCKMYVNPSAAAERIRNAILSTEKNKGR